jgi:hypothetical protein
MNGLYQEPRDSIWVLNIELVREKEIGGNNVVLEYWIG